MSAYISSLLLAGVSTEPPPEPGTVPKVTVSFPVDGPFSGVKVKLTIKDKGPIFVDDVLVKREYSATTGENDNGDFQLCSSAVLIQAGYSGIYLLDCAQAGISGREIQIGPNGGILWDFVPHTP